MKKSRHFSEVSDKRCDEVVGIASGRRILCNKPLKLRLVENKAAGNIRKCFRHHTLSRFGNTRTKF